MKSAYPGSLGLPSEKPGSSVSNSKLSGKSESLKKERDLFFKILQNLNDPVYVKDLESHILLCNPALEKIVGKPASEIIGKTDSEYYDNQALGGKLHDNDLIVMKKGVSQNFEETVNTASGLRIFISKKTPYRDESGKVIGVIGISHDITEFKLAEAKIAESELKYRQLVNHAPVGIYEIDFRTKKLLSINDAMSIITGYTRRELLEMDVMNLLDKESQFSFESRIKKMYEGEIPDDQVTYRIKTKHGKIIHALLKIKFKTDSFGMPVGATVVAHDITDRVKSEMALKESEKRYRDVVQNTSAIILRVTPEGKITFANDRALDFFGYSKEELIGKHAIGTIIPDYDSNGNHLTPVINKIMQSPDRFHLHLNENMCRNGKRVWLEWTNSGVYDHKGNLVEFLAVGIDVTKLRKAELALAANEKKFQSIIESTSDFIWEIDQKGHFTYCSPQMEKLWGLNPGEMIGRTPFDLIPPEEKDLTIKYFNQILESKTPFSGLATSSYDGAGNLIYLEISGVPYFNNKGDLMGYRGVTRDISIRVRAEKELKEAQEKLNIALDNANIGVWEWEISTNLFTLDERLQKMFGVPSGTFKKSFKEIEDLINEEDLAHIRSAVRKSLEEDLPVQTLFRLKPVSGKIKYISAKGLASRDHLGNLKSVSGVCFDITELKEGTEKIISKLNEGLLQSNKELESFAYVASHDLQEPLRMVSSFTQLLHKKYGDKLDQNARDYIQYAVSGAERMYDLINGLLAYSRIHSKGREFSKVKMSLVFDKVINNLQISIKEKNAIVTHGRLPIVSADEYQMVQLIQNLVENAIKFSLVQPVVRVTARTDREFYLFAVRDEGMGIDPQYTDRIFNMFQRLLPRDEYPGTGIGLSICKRIVERHGGKIWVISTPGHGTTFYFTLPKIYTGN